MLGAPCLTGAKWNRIKAELIAMWELVNQIRQLQTVSIKQPALNFVNVA